MIKTARDKPFADKRWHFWFITACYESARKGETYLRLQNLGQNLIISVVCLSENVSVGILFWKRVQISRLKLS